MHVMACNDTVALRQLLRYLCKYSVLIIHVIPSTGHARAASCSCCWVLCGFGHGVRVFDGVQHQALSPHRGQWARGAGRRNTWYFLTRVLAEGTRQ
jgi:hypothetical protein